MENALMMDRKKADELIKRVLDTVSTVIKGKDDIIKKVLMAMLAKGNVLLDDVPGVGKTTMALTFAKSLSLETRRVQFTPDTMPSDIIGFSVYDKESGKLRYKEGAIMTNLFLADEINRTSSKTQAALLEAMEEKKVTVDGISYVLPYPFIVIATQNPTGSSGTMMLPDSQLDRFMIRLTIGYPDIKSQIDILKDRHESNPLDEVASVMTKEELNTLIDMSSLVYVKDCIYEYVAKLVEKTREHEMISLGISPRGALAIVNMSKACAFIEGRDYVTACDVQEVFPYVCAHRLVLNSRARLNEKDPLKLLDSILHETDMPQAEYLR